MDINEALLSDKRLAARHGVRFNVVSRPAGHSGVEADELGRRGRPVQHGWFDDPAEAVGLARALTGHSVTILADGHGPYWHTSRPDEVFSELLEGVCRDKVIGPVEAQREQEREGHRATIRRLRAEQHLPEAVRMVQGTANWEEAINALQARPLELSEQAASYLMSRWDLQRLTRRGREQIAEELNEALTALDDLGPSVEFKL